MPNLKGTGVTPSKKPVTSPSPVVSETPEVTPSPVITPSPIVTTEPVVTTSPEVVVTPEVTPSPEIIVTPEVTPSPVVTTSAPVTDVKPIVKVTTQEGGSINQSYTITAAGTKDVDLSKLAIRYYYDKTSKKEQSFWCDNAGLQLNKAPYYVNLSSDVIGTFHDGYLEITFDTSYALTAGSGSLSMGVRFAQSDWSSYTDFEEKDVVVYYDGEIVS